ncbi:hypothetical protein A6E01_19900 (plasmid) [Vibrio breoganii]|uniref:EF-hand domain-containing protein n=1 Tax=Vibrio breoganii TaxID=553239 RepID=A0AAN1CUU1_9VIBR|nr:ATP-binding protein [Vibrio breoganii]ANO35479.1 hypothetical protein A6E01_19900 [Vibrio breoganii]PML13917.1 hypothetical protein BCT84_12215 [Vibrio breoganii]
MTPGLRRIITINSRPNGKLINEFDFHGATRVIGTNGAGKTSLLKTIGFFFGADRQTVVGGAPQPFVAWYLPNPNSYLIFEYVTNRGNLAHVIVYSDPGRSVEMSYRFVDGAFNKDVIIKETQDELSYAIASSELVANLIEFRCDYTKPISSITTYRSIIQNLNPGNWDREYSRYSLCSGNRNIKHIDRLTIALLQGEFNVESTKKLLLEVIGMQDNDIKIGIDPERIDKWCNDYEAVTSFDKNREGFTEAAANNDTIISESTYLSIAREHLAIEVAHLQDKLMPELKETKAAISKQKDEKLSELYSIRNTLTGDESKHRINLAKLNSELDENAQLSQTYIDVEMAQTVSDYDSLPSLRQNLNQQKQNFADLDRKLTDIEKYRTAKEESITKIHSNAIAKLESEKKDKEHLLDVERKNIEATAASREKTMTSEATQKIESLSLEIASLNTDKGSLEQQLKQPSADKQLLEDKTAIINDLERCRNELTELQTTKLELSKLISTFQQTISNDLNTFDGLQQQLRTKQAQLESLEKLLNPNGKSLYAFLDNHVENWQSLPIGKIATESLLLDTHLNPRIEGAESSLFGINITTDHLPNSPFSTIEMEEKAARLNHEIDVTDKKITSLTQTIKTNKKQEKVDEQKLTQTNTQITQLNNKIELHKANVRSKDIAIDQSIAQNIEDTGHALDATTKQLEHRHSSVKHIKNELAEKIITVQSEKLSKLSDLETTTSQETEALDKSITSHTSQQKEKLNLLKKEISDRRKNEGVSDSVYGQYKTNITALSEKITQLEGQQDTIREYRSFMARQNNYIPQLRKQQETTLDLWEKASTQLKDIHFSIEQETNAFNVKLKTIKRDIIELDNKIAHYDSCQHKVAIELDSSDVGTESFECSDDFDTIAHTTLKLINNVRQLKVLRNQQIRKLEELARTWGEGDLLRFWHESLANKQLDSASNKIKVLNEIITTILPSLSNSVITSSMNMGSMIRNFRDSMINIEGMIKSEGRHISDEVAKFNKFEVIDDIQININSTLQKLAGWEDINTFTAIFNKYDSQASKELPPKEFHSALRTTSTHITKTNNLDVSQLFEVEFDITENGRRKTARTNTEMANLASNGTNLLIQVLLYTAMINSQRSQSNVTVSFPIDEADKLAAQNLERLVDLLKASNINIIAAMPNGKTQTACLFDNLYKLTKAGVITNKPAPTALEDAILRQRSQEAQS